MKANEYARRYADAIEQQREAGIAARNALVDAIFNEYNSEIKRLRIVERAAADKIAKQFNLKGRIIAQMINAKRGKPVIKENFFIDLYWVYRKEQSKREAQKAAEAQTE